MKPPKGYKLVRIEPTEEMLEAMKWQIGGTPDQPVKTWGSTSAIYKAALDASPKPPDMGDGWISVEERLPEKATPEGDINVVQIFVHGEWSCGHCTGTHWIDFLDTDEVGCPTEFTLKRSGVTHWMPLPKPPSPQAGDGE